jgi:hypothetical protein
MILGVLIASSVIGGAANAATAGQQYSESSTSCNKTACVTTTTTYIWVAYGPGPTDGYWAVYQVTSITTYKGLEK